MMSVRPMLHLLCIPFFSLLAVAVLFAVQPSLAAPTQPPPGANVAMPLDAGSTLQVKTGALTVQNTVTAPNMTVNGSLSTSSMCLSGDCRNTWPSANYSTPNIYQVLDQGNDAGYYGINFQSGVGFSFGYSGWSNSGYRSTWPTPVTGQTSCYSKTQTYLTWTYCNGNDIMFGVSTGGSTIYCCNVNVAVN